MQTYTKRISLKEYEIYQLAATAQLAPEIIHASIEQNLIILTTKAIPYTFGELATSEEQITRLAVKQDQQLAQLHDLGIYHGDISEENVLFDEKEKCYLIDFGLSRTFKDITSENLETQLDEYQMVDLKKITSSEPAEQIKEAEHLEVCWLSRQFQKKL